MKAYLQSLAFFCCVAAVIILASCSSRPARADDKNHGWTEWGLPDNCGAVSVSVNGSEVAVACADGRVFLQ